MASRFIVPAILLACSGIVAAQGLPKDYMDLQAAMMAAQASAVRPGDETLGCEPLQKELVASMNDPALQAYAAKSSAEAAKQLSTREKTRTAMTPEAAAALAAALNPAAALAGFGGMPTQAQIAQSQQVMLQQMKQLVTIMPVLMRSQRVMMLAAMKSCTWATGAGLLGFPGIAPLPRQ
jgi:hypothetical protein